MRDRFGVTVAGGQGQLKGQIVRVAHCGYYGAFDIVIALSALEMALRELGLESSPARVPAPRSRCSPTRASPRRRSGNEGPPAAGSGARRVPRVLVKEKIAESGVELLRERASRSSSGLRCPTRSWPSGSASSTRS